MNKKPNPLNRIFELSNPMAVLALTMSVCCAAVSVHSQALSKQDIRQQAEAMCAQWAEEDAVAADELEGFIADCIVDFMLDEEEAEKAS